MMKVTINLNSDLLNTAKELTGISDITALVRAGLEALIERESARRLKALGGTMPGMRPIPRRRSAAED